MTTINGFIYKISSNDNKMNYYGYTTSTIQIRYYRHIYSYISYYTQNKLFDQYEKTLFKSYLHFFEHNIKQHIHTFIHKNYKIANCASFIIFNHYHIDDIKIDIIETLHNTTLEIIQNKERHYIQHYNCVNIQEKQILPYYTFTERLITQEIIKTDIPIILKPNSHIIPIIHLFGYNIDQHYTLTHTHNVLFTNIKKQLHTHITTYYPQHKITSKNLLSIVNTLLKQHHLQIIKSKILTTKIYNIFTDYNLLLLSYTPVSQQEAQLFLEQLFIQKQNNTS